MAIEYITADMARQSLRAGANKAFEIVGVTLGAASKQVVIDSLGRAKRSDDGVTVMEHTRFPDRYEDMGAQFLFEGAQRVNEEVGDATSTYCALHNSIMNQAFKMMNATDLTLPEIEETLLEGASYAIEELRKRSFKCDEKDIKAVATVSSLDPKVGEMISSSIKEIGRDGIFIVEKHDKSDTSVEIVKGIQFDKGYIAPFMVTDIERSVAEFKDALILVTDEKITKNEQIKPLLTYLFNEGKSNIVIIADEVEGQALMTLAMNRANETIHAVCVKAPYTGARRSEFLQDIASMFKAKFISPSNGSLVATMEPSDLGNVKSAKITQSKTILAGGEGDIKPRIKAIKESLESAKDFDKEFHKRRLAFLTGGTAIIRVGTPLDSDSPRLEKVEDAIHAARNAQESGIIIGGGAALVKVGKSMDRSTLGRRIIAESLSAPLRQMALNAGLNPSKAEADIENGGEFVGYDFRTAKLVDMKEAGIFDPFKAMKVALEVATKKVIDDFIKSEVLTKEIDEQEKPRA